MQDTVDIIKTIQNVYENDPVFSVLKDYERVLDELGLYVYANWEDGELLAGPKIGRHFVECSFMYPRDKMPDPMGGKRLLDYDCKVTYKKDHLVEPRKIIEPDDVRPGTKKGKLDKTPIWVVTIIIPKELMKNINMPLPIKIKAQPKIIAFSGKIIPAGIGRKFVRCIILSDSASAK